MVRIPSAIVGVFAAVALDALVFAVALAAARPELLTALLPLCALAGGFIAGRWSGDAPIVPGFSVGLITIAARIGLGLGIGLGALAFVWPPLALLELISAIVGGMCGIVAARRELKLPALSFELRA
jgi:hypothetical protein